MTRLILAFLPLFGAQSAAAQREFREFRTPGAAVTLRPDRAYLLFRLPQPPGVYPNQPIFLRIPTADEMSRYLAARRAAFATAEPRLMREYQNRLQRRRSPSDPEPRRPSLETFEFRYSATRNMNFVDFNDEYWGRIPERVYLIEALPGDYVLYGLMGWGGGIGVCMCLGTVGFSAEPGVITDLGYFLSDLVRAESALPELRAESGFGPSSGDPTLTGATVRPPRADSTMPPTLRSLPIRSVQYRAIGRFIEPRTYLINRLAPVPGVLDYRDGRVIDVASGQMVPDNY